MDIQTITFEKKQGFPVTIYVMTEIIATKLDESDYRSKFMNTLEKSMMIWKQKNAILIAGEYLTKILNSNMELIYEFKHENLESRIDWVNGYFFALNNKK